MKLKPKFKIGDVVSNKDNSLSGTIEGITFYKNKTKYRNNIEYMLVINEEGLRGTEVWFSEKSLKLKN